MMAMEDLKIVDGQEKMVHLWTVSIKAGADGSHAVRRITSGNFSVSAWDFSLDLALVVLVRQARILHLYEYPAVISLLDLKSSVMKDIVPPV